MYPTGNGKPRSPIVVQQDQEDRMVEEDLFGEEDMEVGEGAHEVDRIVGKVRKDPGAPSAEEVARHAATHLLSRSWCRHCVNGRG